MSSSSRVGIAWEGEGQLFRGGTEGGPSVVLDGDGREGVTPTNTVLLAVAGCMGIDVVDILEKSRVPLDTLRVEIEAERAPSPPRRFTSIRLAYKLSGPGEKDWRKVERAVALSREKYCSVLHSLREDIDFRVEIERI